MDPFTRRHIGSTAAQQQQMLESLGLNDMEQLLGETIPADIRSSAAIAFPAAADEAEATAILERLLDANVVLKSLYGQGYHPCHTPSAIRRYLLENPGWYTAYTPYQAEISQGRLEMLSNFQHLIQGLTGLEVAGASLLDDASAAAEAMQMIARCNPAQVQADKSFFIDSGNHSQLIAVCRTRARYLGLTLEVAPLEQLAPERCFGALLAYPHTGGEVVDLSAATAALQSHKALVAFSTDLLALCLLPSPASLGADLVVGSAQRLGMPMGYGGPHAGFIACRSAWRRQLPGRLIALSKDAAGRPALRMALQTREQHIRREKATSNICTAQALPAMIAAAYALYHGPEGLYALAQRVHSHTQSLERLLAASGYANANGSYFDTLRIHTASNTRAIAQKLLDSGYLVRVYDSEHICLSLNECLQAADLEAIAGVFASAHSQTGKGSSSIKSAKTAKLALNPDAPKLAEVFSKYHSETNFMRYLQRLRNKDIALDTSMIALGSCTMKLNAACELAPILWERAADLHPFAPKSHCLGYQSLFNDLTDLLCALTGFHTFSFQPNSGAQGEYSGLLAIRAYHQQRGEHQRDICLIPASAHGTNPASAIMAGLRVITLKSSAAGNIDQADLQAKLAEHGARLAAMMITYPSTHGVFESGIKQVCAAVHAAGGQVYLDGANYNAQVGLVRPAEVGFDVMHINLHKTFCIPHGGGGPGMGPIGVQKHLCPFLPQHPNNAECDHAVASAPYGSAMILPISWMYLRLMGLAGLQQATSAAILHANYIANRLQPHYPILYRGDQGRIAHECIIDIRPLKQACGVSAEDIAKRLIDFGFHAPTLSFPVVDTLMIEPTESEDLEEIERFCSALIAIKAEIDAINSGALDSSNNPLKNAPHHAELLLGTWPYPYDSRQACYPDGLDTAKYWPPVARVDNVYGDRQLLKS